MTKKWSYILFIGLFIFILGGCSSDDLTDSKEVDELTENVGNTKEEVFKNLNITEGEEIEVYDVEMPFLYVFKEKRTLYGESLDLILTFDAETNEMYGFQYVGTFEDGKDEDGKDAYELTKKLSDEFDKAYGEPTTYPGTSSRIASIPNYEELWEDETTGYFETWKKDDTLAVQLQIGNYEGQGNLVEVTYSPNPPEQDYSGE